MQYLCFHPDNNATFVTAVKENAETKNSAQYCAEGEDVRSN